MTLQNEVAGLVGRGDLVVSKVVAAQSYPNRTSSATEIARTDNLGEWRNVGEVSRVLVEVLVARRCRVPALRARLVTELAGLGRRAA